MEKVQDYGAPAVAAISKGMLRGFMSDLSFFFRLGADRDPFSRLRRQHPMTALFYSKRTAGDLLSSVASPTLPHIPFKCPPDHRPSSLPAHPQFVISPTTAIVCSQPLGQTFRPGAASPSSSENEHAVREFQAVVSDHHIVIVAVRKGCSLGLNFHT